MVWPCKHPLWGRSVEHKTWSIWRLSQVQEVQPPIHCSQTSEQHYPGCALSFLNRRSWHNLIALERHLTYLQSASQHLFNVMNFRHFEKNTNDPATSSKFFLRKKGPKFDRFWKQKLRIIRFLHYALVGSHKIEGTYEPRRNIMPCNVSANMKEK